MADIDDILSQSSDGGAYYVPSDDDYEQVAEGTYPAHITDLNIVNDITIRKTGSKADIYKPVYKIAEEAGNHVGRVVKSGGIFRFKSPPPDSGEKRESTSGNRSYKKFLDACSVPLEENKDPNNGESSYSLPTVTREDIYGYPVMIRVRHKQYELNGELRTSVEANLLYSWGDGNKLPESEEIPF
tara:strand:- start:921 stop:1475 length:555 start_codon:yes stop_codon:yes gene_type:complete